MSRKRKAKKRKSPLRKTGLTLAVVLLLLLGYYVVQFAQFLGDIRSLPTEQGEDEEIVPTPMNLDYPRTNILLLGIDARNPREASRTDTIMILSYDNNTGEASLLSIPRDSRVNIPSRGLDKINHAHAFGGVALTIKTVEEFLEIPVHYYARVNFIGFQTIINTLGGVTIDVESIVAKNQKELNPGLQRLNGYQALIYVRNRSDSDIGRAKRQQKLLRSVAKESLQLRTIAKAPQLLDSLGDNMRTNMPVKDMTRIARMFLNIDFDRIPQGVVPGKGQYINKISYWVVDVPQTKELLKELGLKEQ